MRKLAFVLVAFVAGCGGGGSTQVGTSSTPPGGGSNGGGVGTPMPGGGADGGAGGGAPGSGGGGSGGSGGSGGGGGSGGIGGGGGGSGAGGGGSGGGGGVGGPSQPPCSSTAVTFATSTKPGPIAVHAGNLYWLDVASPRGIYRGSLSGAPAQQLGVDSRATTDFNFYLAVDDDGVYWASTLYRTGQSAGDSIVYALRSDGHVDALAETAANDGLVLADSTLFFSDRYGVYSVATNGSGKQTLLSQFGEGPITVDPWHVFAFRGGTLLRLDRTGGTPTTLGQLPGQALTVDFNFVYVVEYNGIYAVPPATGTRLSPPATSGFQLVTPFVVRDGTTLYFSSPYGELARISTDGSGYTVLAPSARSAVVAGDTLYYSHDGVISAVCK